MSAATYFGKKCVEKVRENIALTIAKFSDPASLVQIDASSALKEAAKGNFGSLASAAGDYLEQNSDALLLQALKVTGLENTALDALNLFYNMLAQAIAAYNDLLLLLLKKTAENIVVEINDKEKINQIMKQALTNLHNGLLAISSGNPVFDKYVAQLRAALIELDSGRGDIELVRNTLNQTDRYLGKTFKSGKAKVESALSKIKPLDNNPYLSTTYTGLLNNIGIQTDKQQIINIMAIPRLCREVISASQGYVDSTVKINAMLVSYYAGLQQLQTGIPSVMKKYIISRFDSTLVKLKDLIRSMGLTLNGSETSILRPQANYEVTPITVSVLAFKWAMDGTLVHESFKLIPAGHVVVSRRANGKAPPKTIDSGKRLLAAESGDFRSVQINDTLTVYRGTIVTEYKVKEAGNSQLLLDKPLNSGINPINNVDYEVTSDALGALQLNFAVVDAYKESVQVLRTYDTVNSGNAALIATDAQENFTVFAGQLLTFLLEATGASVSAKVRPAALSQCRGFIRRCDLVTSRDTQIKAALQAFIDTPIPLDDTLKQMHDGLMTGLRGMGLDRAADLLESGDFASFFKLNGKNATYVGAALEAVALLKDCFDNDNDRNRLSEIENNMKGDAELLNFKISFNFDIAIFKNLKDCLNLKALANLFDTKEILCGLLEDAGVGTLFNKLNDLLSF